MATVQSHARTRRVATATAITACRMTGSARLVSLLDFGSMALTGVFLAPGVEVPRSPVELMLCLDSGLVQLRHSYNPSTMYGPHYGYRSGLNGSMVRHLAAIAAQLETVLPLQSGDVVLDIGSNDGTLLSAYRPHGQCLVGMDPLAAKYAAFYPASVRTVPEFFSVAAYRRTVGLRQARLVTSIAMLYDLEQPLAFMQAVSRILADEGLWYCEQSYLPSLLDQCAYDTICHEHLEYYGLTQLQWMADRADLRIVEVSENDTNGGSFAVTFAKRRSAHRPQQAAIDTMLASEAARGLGTPAAYTSFVAAVDRHRVALPAVIRSLRAEGKTIVGYGASTKGNVLLQACGLTRDDLPCIADVNPDKYGCVTPGTHIPIVSEAEAHALAPDYLLVLPWHFRTGIVAREQAFLARGGQLIFPLPTITIQGAL